MSGADTPGQVMVACAIRFKLPCPSSPIKGRLVSQWISIEFEFHISSDTRKVNENGDDQFLGVGCDYTGADSDFSLHHWSADAVPNL